MAGPGTVQIGRISRFLTKWLGSKGQSPNMFFGSEITPVLPLWSGAENRVLDSWNRFGIGTSATGGGTNPAALRIRNPVGSNIVVVVEKANISSSILDTLILQYFTVSLDLTTVIVSTNTRLDSRGAANPVAIVSSSVNFAHGGVPTLSATMPASQSYDFLLTDIQEIPILPGDAITLQTSGVTAILTGGFMWRERVLEDSERTG